MSELWRPVQGYEGRYEVSSYGNIRSVVRTVVQRSIYGHMTRVYRSRLLKPRVGNTGYLYVNLSKDGKRRTVKNHRVTCIAFHQQQKGKIEVNHKDGNKLNNHASNLEWCTSSENKQHAVNAGLKKNPHGAESHGYKGPIFVHKDGVLLHVLHGAKDVASKGYTVGGAYAALVGVQKTHRGCTFTREN